MALVEMIMPKMGESVAEATIIKWLKSEGEKVEADEMVLEIATDKVDSEVPSPVEGVLSKLNFKEGDVVKVGEIIAMIESDSAATGSKPSAPAPAEEPAAAPAPTPQPVAPQPVATAAVAEPVPYVPEATEIPRHSNGHRFYSPLVRNIAQKEGITVNELDALSGTGAQGRVTKKDILGYITQKASGAVTAPPPEPTAAPAPATNGVVTPSASKQPLVTPSSFISNGEVEIIEMDRMRKLIAEHMVMSKQTSPHVTSYVEADVTNIVNWRNKVKKDFQQREKQKITYTPIFIEAIVKAIKDFPLINVSVDGDKILKKNFINIGMAAALPSGNLIVPVIKNADRMNLLGLTQTVNDLAGRARDGKLKPDEIQDGTYTVTNVGTFGNVMGTPIINQPQAAIMAVGAIRKKPAVVETPNGDAIGIRHMMFLSHAYDHRVIDGALGGSFVRRVADYLEQFDVNQTI
ncbi:MAG: 2-oxo acid dehydrogenase subunit E2 [Bacteroidia bacterium]|nr:2-oxo acid dehydrogenase subunit E2 [Bacteroidia bacterium]NNM16289.1 2-oxo acid dehydrogenase subunit E2 [Bacteroidia bacterium]